MTHLADAGGAGRRSRLPGVAGWGVFAVAWPLVIALTLPLADGFRMGGDEGHELVKAACWVRNGQLPVEGWNDQPLTHTRLYAAMLGIDYSPLGPRLWSVTCFGILLASVGHVAHTIFRRAAAGLGAAFVVSAAPQSSLLAASSMQEMPATALGMLSLALVLSRSGPPSMARLGWAAMAGGLGLAIKLTAAVYVVCAAGLLAVAAVEAGRNTIGASRESMGDTAFAMLRGGLGRIVAYLSGVGGVGGVLLWGFDGRSLEGLLGSHFGAFGAASSSGGFGGFGRWVYLARSYPQMVVFVGVGAWLVGLGAWRMTRRQGGAALSAKDVGDAERWGRHGVPGCNAAWIGQDFGSLSRVAILPVGLSLANVAIQPWWTYYGLSVWIGYSGLAGYALAWAWGEGRGALAEGWQALGKQSFGGLAAWALMLGSLQTGAEALASLRSGRSTERARNSPLLATIEVYSRQAVAPSIYAEDPLFAFWSRLPVPPALVVVTEKRYLSGHLRPGDIPRHLRAVACDFLVLRQGRQKGREPELDRLLAESYVLTTVSGGFELHVHRRYRPLPYESRLRW